MYDYLIGTVTFLEDDHLILEVQGVGYRVHATHNVIVKATGETGLFKVFVSHYVREETEKLFGFAGREERAFFEWLGTLSGIGPKTALGIMNAASLEELLHHAGRDNAAFFQKIPGIGKKTAEKMVVDLKNQKRFSIREMQMERLTGHISLFDDAFSALEKLGFKEIEIKTSLKKLLEAAPPSLSLQELIRSSLQTLTRVNITGYER